MKKILFILIMAVIQSSGLCSAETAGYDNLKYDFAYMYKWTLQKMNVRLNPDKPVPSLAFTSFDRLQNIIDERYNLKRKYSCHDGMIIATYEYYSIYEPKEITIFMANNAHELKHKPMECLIVHEIVHSTQHIYQGYNENSPEGEKEADKFANIFCQEHFK